MVKKGVMFLFFILLFVSFASSSYTNWALPSNGGKVNCYSSSCPSTQELNKAIDGDASTYVVLTKSDPSDYIVVNLSSMRNVTNIAINSSSTKLYKLVISVYNGSDWIPIHSSWFFKKSFDFDINGNYGNISAVRINTIFKHQGNQDNTPSYIVNDVKVFGPSVSGGVAPSVVCGDGNCQGSENCLKCPQDCACGSNEICKISLGGNVAGCFDYSCDSDNDTIMKLSDTENSHGALWNDTNYKVGLCYSGIFGLSYNYGGEDLHNCVGKKPLFWLSGLSNAHISTYSDSVYNVPVCYGNLECVNRTNSCEDGEVALASLYSIYNSHISIGDYIDYPIKICCKEQSASLNIAYWKNMNGERINQAPINASVKLYLSDSSLVQGNTVNFTIYDKDNQKVGFVSSLSKQGYAEALWKVSVPLSYNGKNLTFNATYMGKEVSSDYLTINNSLDNHFVVNWISPKCGEDYRVGENFTISINISEPFGLAKGILKITGSEEIEKEFQNGFVEFNQSIRRAGNINLYLAVNSSRNEFYRKSVNIMIVDPTIERKYVAACITSPPDMSNLPKGDVFFNASTSRGILNKSGQEIDLGPENLTFYWYFSDTKDPYVAKGSDGPNAYLFFRVFHRAGRHWARLEVRA